MISLSAPTNETTFVALACSVVQTNKHIKSVIVFGTNQDDRPVFDGNVLSTVRRVTCHVISIPLNTG